MTLATRQIMSREGAASISTTQTCQQPTTKQPTSKIMVDGAVSCQQQKQRDKRQGARPQDADNNYLVDLVDLSPVVFVHFPYPKFQIAQAVCAMRHQPSAHPSSIIHHPSMLSVHFIVFMNRKQSMSLKPLHILSIHYLPKTSIWFPLHS